MYTKVSFKILLSIFVFTVTAIVYSQYGFNGKLNQDDAIYLYSGQQITQGVSPYISIFDPKGPLTSFIAGVSVYISNIFYVNDILGVRITFFILSGLSVVVIYLLGLELFKSHKVGLLAAFIFFNYWGLGKFAASGPRPKAMMLLFQGLAILFSIKKRWFWSGLSGSLAFLTWQPMLVFPLVNTFLAFVQSSSTKKTRNSLIAILGFFIPLIVISSYFIYKNSFNAFLEGMLVHFAYSNSFDYLQFSRIVNSSYKGYKFMLPFIAIGVIGMMVIYIWRIKINRKKFFDLIHKDSFAILLLTFPAPLIWSLIDYQSYPDFFVFLPYLAISAGWLIYLILHNFFKQDNPIVIFLCLLLFLFGIYQYRITSENKLEIQKEWVKQIKLTKGLNDQIIVINKSEFIAISHSKNPSSYILINNEISELMDGKLPGGFDAWMKELYQYEIIILSLGMDFNNGFENELVGWINSNYSHQKIGEWDVYRRV